MRKIKRLDDGYSFRGFRTLRKLKGLFGDPFARVIVLKRRGKKQFVAHAARSIGPAMTGSAAWFAISPTVVSVSS